MDSGWKRDNGPTLSLGAGLSWQYCGFLLQSHYQLWLPPSPPNTGTNLYKPCYVRDQPLHEKPQCRQRLILENSQRPGCLFLQDREKTPTNSAYGLTHCCFCLTASCTPVTPLPHHVNIKHYLFFLFTSCKWTVTQLGKIIVTVQLTSNVYRLDSEQKPDEH